MVTAAPPTAYNIVLTALPVNHPVTPREAKGRQMRNKEEKREELSRMY
jgi:hypothetical protein